MAFRCYLGVAFEYNPHQQLIELLLETNIHSNHIQQQQNTNEYVNRSWEISLFARSCQIFRFYHAKFYNFLKNRNTQDLSNLGKAIYNRTSTCIAQGTSIFVRVKGMTMSEMLLQVFWMHRFSNVKWLLKVVITFQMLNATFRRRLSARTDETI